MCSPADEEVGRLLVLSDFAESNSARAITIGLQLLENGLSGDLRQVHGGILTTKGFARGLSSNVLARLLVNACH
jgi:hypothetical protein